MPEYYLIIVVLLFILAISDLVVGVSNDAVNFLNSAIGSQVASRKTIMIVASLGILVGATFSSGMMEVARKGVFNPELFFFSEIMVVFIAVMITDIILLDLFNTFGMPTSTTVSIVFELLGAAVAIALLKISTAGESIGTLDQYINSSSAVLIISGIFLSVLIAFFVGAFVQYISRLLFSFHIKKRIHSVGVLWAGFALSALTFFLLIKGAKGASFISDDFLAWVNENRPAILFGNFIFWSALMFIFSKFFKINILRIVVLFGTFALAMAFAGNDLVNFIGVPIAGFESYLYWSSSGMAAENFSMEILNQPVRTETYLLILAGLIMITTLWFSKKARSVTETEVNLGRQNEGGERFSPNTLSKGIVRYTLTLGKGFQKIVPQSWLDKAGENFEPVEESEKEENPPAFDLVRASVNLTVASILIAVATSFKLPLSTTYVSFMVAMGTSLSDRAWGRNSAVYRVAGVINVIGGWFFTAFVAFSAAAVFASIIYFLKIWGILLLVGLVIFLVSRTFLLHRKKEKQKLRIQELQSRIQKNSSTGILEETTEKVASTLKIIQTTYSDALLGLLNEDRALLKKALKDIEELKAENEELKHSLFTLLKGIKENSPETNRIYLLIYDLEQDIVQSTSLIVDACYEHVSGSLEPISGKQEKELKALLISVENYLSDVIQTIENRQFSSLELVLTEKKKCLDSFEKYLQNQVKGIKNETFGMRNSLLNFSIALETKDLIAVAARFVKLYDRLG